MRVEYSLAEIESFLDSGSLEVEMRSGRYWQIRRNGQTKTWKRDPERFRIPFKCGLRTTGAIESLDLASQGIRIKAD